MTANNIKNIDSTRTKAKIKKAITFVNVKKNLRKFSRQFNIILTLLCVCVRTSHDDSQVVLCLFLLVKNVQCGDRGGQVMTSCRNVPDLGTCLTKSLS